MNNLEQQIQKILINYTDELLAAVKAKQTEEDSKQAFDKALNAAKGSIAALIMDGFDNPEIYKEAAKLSGNE